MRYLLHEPVVHFFLIAMILLGGHAVYQSHFQPVIALDQEAVSTLILADNFEKKRQGSDDDARELVRNYVQEEILYREALKRDMIASEPVKELLIQQLRKELEPVVGEPSDAQLRQIYEKTLDQHLLPRQVSFTHVSYHKVENVPVGLLKKLQAGENPAAFGEPVQLANPLPLTYQTQLDRVLGKPASAEVFKHGAGEWFGPISSRRGVHFVRILEKVEGKPMPFDIVRNTLKVNWIQEQKRKVVDAELSEMARTYRINVPEAYRDVLP